MPAENDERNLLNNGAEEVYSNVRWSGTHQNLSDSLERLQIEGPHAVKGIPALPSVFAIFSPLLSITCVFGEVFGKASFWGQSIGFPASWQVSLAAPAPTVLFPRPLR